MQEEILKAAFDVTEWLAKLASIDPELASLVSEWPWVGEKMNQRDFSILLDFQSIIASHDLEMARRIAAQQWSYEEADDVDHWIMVRNLTELAKGDFETAKKLSAFPWFTDGLTNEEVQVIDVIVSFPEAGTVMAMSPWLDDEITGDESRAFRYLLDLAGRASSEILEIAIEHFGPSMDDLDFQVLDSLMSMSTRMPEALHELAGQHWFFDGLDRHEAALTATLYDLNRVSPGAFSSFLRSPHFQSSTISLPLAGKINIWAIQNATFPPGDNLLEATEAAARDIENFIGAPFPTSEIIAVVIVPAPGFSGPIGAGRHLDGINQHSRDDNGQVSLYTINHEMAHYYFNATIGDTWLIEGGAELMVACLDHIHGRQNWEHSKREALFNYPYCIEQGFPSIQHLNFYQSHDPSFPLGCSYALGKHFLMSLFDVLGQEGLASAVRQLHQANTDDTKPSDEDIYEAFFTNTPPDSVEAFKELFDRLYGPPLEIPDSDSPDDHGDTKWEATPISPGETLEASLDSFFDYDYFVMDLQEGREYRVEVGHLGEGYSRATLVAADASSLPIESTGRWGLNRSMLRWSAPSTGKIYLVVTSPKDDVLDYQLTFALTAAQ